MLNYDPSDKDSIYQYAKKLKGLSFNEICEQDDYFLTQVVKDVTSTYYKSSHENKKRKGGLGEIIEERFFHYKADSEARADFPEAGVELKVTPYKLNKKGEVTAKERLIISMINYMNIVDIDFENSNVWKKIENILLIYYLWEKDITDRLDYVINFVHMYSPNEQDLEIIKKDFYNIKQKVLEGKAHELSEGDTLYLGAATKSSDSSKRTKQPFSEIEAKPRAFSFKNSYMTYVLRNYILPDNERDESIIKNEEVNDFETFVLGKIRGYIGSSEKDLFNNFFGGPQSDKSRYSRLALRMLGVNTENAEEFEKANIEVKAIRVEKNKKIRESISFPHFKFMDFISEEWEESEIYTRFSETKYLFVVFESDGTDYILKGAKFWNMPANHINEKLYDDWKNIKGVLENGVQLELYNGRVLNNFPKKKYTNIIHIRPHASKAAYKIKELGFEKGDVRRDGDILPNGDYMTKQCYWLNNDYVLESIKDLI